MSELDKDRAVELLNRILEAELAGVVRYTHYSFLVFGHNRIPIVSWLREQAAESLTHAQQAGEMITLLGEYPSLAIGPLLDSHQTDIGAVMRESLETEAKALALYRERYSRIGMFENVVYPGIADFGISLAAGAVPLVAIELLRKAQSHPT